MILKTVTGGIVAGAAAGLFAGLLQLAFVQPVLLHAELYESGQLVHFGAETPAALATWPGIDPVRDGLSLLFSMLVYTGYGLLLTAVIMLSKGEGTWTSWREGLVWGVCGFIAAHLAPAYSLPPEVPGVAYVDVGPRQAWWAATIGATAVALWLLAFTRRPWAPVLALVLFSAPHVIGAPQPDSFEGPVPPELAALFAARALGTGLAAWAALGAAVALVGHGHSTGGQ
jgi:cobalt transporter subunit CbtA